MSETTTTALRTKLNWYWYWYVTRRVELVPFAIAQRVPKWLRYYVANDAVAKYTIAHPQEDVGSIIAIDVLHWLYHKEKKNG